MDEKNELNQRLPSTVSNIFLIILVAMTLGIAFGTYQLHEEMARLEIKLQRSDIIHRTAIEAMKQQGMLDEFISLADFTEEEREQIRAYVEEIAEEEIEIEDGVEVDDENEE